MGTQYDSSSSSNGNSNNFNGKSSSNSNKRRSNRKKADVDIDLIGFVEKYSIEINSIKNEVENIKNALATTEQFYESGRILNEKISFVMPLFIVIPLVQILVCAFLAYYFGTVEKLDGFYKTLIGSVSFFSAVEVFWGGISVKGFGQKNTSS